MLVLLKTVGYSVSNILISFISYDLLRSWHYLFWLILVFYFGLEASLMRAQYPK